MDEFCVSLMRMCNHNNRGVTVLNIFWIDFSFNAFIFESLTLSSVSSSSSDFIRKHLILIHNIIFFFFQYNFQMVEHLPIVASRLDEALFFLSVFTALCHIHILIPTKKSLFGYLKSLLNCHKTLSISEMESFVMETEATRAFLLKLILAMAIAL